MLNSKAAQMQNVITCNNVTLHIAKKQLPYSNNFVQQSATLQQYKGKDEVHAVVVCTNDSKEPLRMYSCIYSMKGVLLGCCTLN